MTLLTARAELGPRFTVPTRALTCHERMPQIGDVIYLRSQPDRLHVVDRYNNEHGWVECHLPGEDAFTALLWSCDLHALGVYHSRADGGAVTMGEEERR